MPMLSYGSGRSAHEARLRKGTHDMDHSSIRWGNMPFTSAATVTCPCMGCADRHAECHGACKKYAAYKADTEAAKVAEVKARIAEANQRTKRHGRY